MSGAEFEPGTTFSGYRIDRLLRRTATAGDYLLVPDGTADRGLLRVPDQQVTDPAVARLLRTQAATLRQLHHPSVRAVTDIVIDGDRAGLLLPHLPGRTLTELIDERGGWPAAAERILRPVAEALDYAHTRGVLHGNLSPDAVLLEPGGDRPVLVFDLEPPAAADVGSTLTGAEEPPPPSYRAPEQLAGDRLSHRSDLYSFGCLAFALLTGSAPFRGTNVFAQAMAPAGEPVPRASERNPDLPVAVDAVFDTALAKAPTDRFPSAGALVDALLAALGPTPAVGGRSRRIGRRGRWWPAAALAVLLAVVLAGVGTVLLVGRADAPPPVTARLVGQPITVGAGPSDIEAGAGFVWTSNRQAGSISRIDPASGAVLEIPVGGEPAQLVVGDDAVYVRNQPTAVVRVDLPTGAVSPPATDPSPVTGMAFGAGSLWLSHAGQGTVTRHDPRTLVRQGEPIKVGVKPRALLFGSRLLYVLNSGDSTLVRLDPATGALVGSPLFLPEGVGGMEVAGGIVYVAAGSGVVPVPEDAAVVGEPYRLEGFSYFELDGRTMWVVYEEEDVMRRLDLTSQTFLGEPLAGVGAQLGRARVAAGELWATLPDANQVIRLAPASG